MPTEPSIVPSHMNTRFLTELAREVVEAARVRPGERVGTGAANATGGTLIRPGGGDCYPAFWIRDFALSLACGLIPAEEQRHALLLTARTQAATDRQLPSGSRIPRGAVADHILFDGTPIFFPGTYDPENQGGAWGRLPAFDNHYCFVEMAWQYVRQTGDRDVLREDVNGLPLCDRLELAFGVPPTDSGSELVACGEADRGVSFGFMDAIVQTGSLLFASLLRRQAARQLAELTGKPHYARIADAIAAALPATFPTTGGLLRASTGLSAQPDVWGSAYAVYTDAVTGPVRNNIGRALANAYRAGTLAWRGNIRHLLTTDDFGPATAWERLVQPTPRNHYQNGAYWGTPTGWVCAAIASVDAAAARQLADEYLADLRQHDFRQGGSHGAPWECLHPDGNHRQNPVYMTSVTVPLAAFLRCD